MNQHDGDTAHLGSGPHHDNGSQMTRGGFVQTTLAKTIEHVLTSAMNAAATPKPSSTEQETAAAASARTYPWTAERIVDEQPPAPDALHAAPGQPATGRPMSRAPEMTEEEGRLAGMIIAGTFVGYTAYHAGKRIIEWLGDHTGRHAESHSPVVNTGDMGNDAGNDAGNDVGRDR